MKVSLNTIKQFIDFDLPSVDELKKRINEQLGKVESVTDLAAKYKDAVIVRVVSAEKHPNADKLSVCWVDDGGSVAGIPRNEQGYVQVVCGAPNVHGDMFAIWLPPKATVPASYDDAEPFVLSARELRGVVSQGMLAAADELAVGSDHSGIIELTDVDLHPRSDVKSLKPGLNFAETFGLNDIVLELENKMFTHRPDCFGQLGVAREIAGIFNKEFVDPKWYWGREEFAQGAGLELNVFNEAAEKVPRFMAAAMKGVTVKPSPFWLQAELVRLGSKAINNIVDATNYSMLLTGQPVHAYDYDKLRGNTLGVRLAKTGEAATLLNGKSYELVDGDIVIVDGEGVVGLAGVMGGGNSEVSETTRNIVLEVATFDMYAVRKTSMRHGLFTDAVTRFSKGQSPLQNDRVLRLLINSVMDLAGGDLANNVVDLHALGAAYEQQSISGTLKVEAGFINERLGFRLAEEEIERLLRNVHFACFVEPGDTVISITAPFWRTDIELPEDIVEEVGRMYGFDKLPKELPMRSVKPVAKNVKREVAQMVRQSLARSGANEVLTYSFVHKNVIDRANQNASKAFQLSNALSPDLQYYRLSVLPSLLDKVHANVKSGYNEFALFELGKAHSKDSVQGDLPNEFELAEAIYASKNEQEGAAYYRVKAIVEQLAHDLGIAVSFANVDELPGDRFAMFDPHRSALVRNDSGVTIGVVGELEQRVTKAFKLPSYAAGISLSLAELMESQDSIGVHYAPLSKFPSLSQDISLRVAVAVHYNDITWAVKRSLEQSEFTVAVAPLSIYQGEDKQKKTITLSLRFTSQLTTLTSADIAPLIEQAVLAVTQQYGAELA